MRQIEKDVIGSFIRGEERSLSNTMTDGTHLFLHGNVIAGRLENGDIEVSNAGWETRTTQSRLNALCQLLGLRSKVFTRKFEMYIEDLQGDDILMGNKWHKIGNLSGGVVA
tara:strand:- start:3474 stop:3806 length:333 start_codon:yes stop_codon:yes gene_type:complete